MRGGGLIFKLMNDAARFDSKGDIFSIEAPQGTDFFIDPGSETSKTDAPFYCTEIHGDFILRCEVAPQFSETYDAGFLCAYESSSRWIKLAFERTDLGYQSVVSVVTDGTSDDCNGERIEGDSIWLQIVRKNTTWCLHHSHDGRQWKMARYFFMEMNQKVMIGIAAQSPLGKGCLARFKYLAVDKMTYDDIRFAR
jgi:uncharacterized protein